jgi:hypothetical protein
VGPGGVGEDQARPTEGASVVMEIGGAVGGVVVHTPDGLEGDEIEVWAEDGTGPLTHAIVRRRHMRDGCRLAAVFPALDAGDYTLHSVQDLAAGPRSVRVRGGQVTAVDW